MTSTVPFRPTARLQNLLDLTGNAELADGGDTGTTDGQTNTVHEKALPAASKLEMTRAFGVVFGGPLALNAIAAAAAATSLRAACERRMPPRWAVASNALVAAYVITVRPWMSRRHEIVIDASAERVWPWVAQMGQDRAGFYSYESLENLAGCRMRNSDRIHPEWQQREIGETVYLHPRYGMRVTRFEPSRALALQGWGSFELEPAGTGRTRLVCRGEDHETSWDAPFMRCSSRSRTT